MKTSGNKILITGAGTGMGLAAAQFFYERGNEVIMVARNETRLKEESEKLGKGAYYYTCDLSDKVQLDGLVKEVKQKHANLNVVFLNAGIANNYSLLDGKDTYEISKTEMITNFHSAVFLTHELESVLSANEDPIMILTTSGVAFAPDLLHPTYSATKAAMHNYILGLRLVLQRKKSSIKLFELMAPLVDSPFSKGVSSDLKVAPIDVIKTMVNAIENNEFEIRPGLTEDIYKVYLKSPQEALLFINNATGS